MNSSGRINTRKAILLKTFLILLLIYITAVVVRVAIYENNRYASFIPMTQESAFHYYFAKKIADGKPIPVIDYDMQHPEGLRVFETTSIFMEYVAGYLYRAVKFVSGIRFDFTNYISVFVPLFSCLAVFGLYSMAKLLLGDNEAALISALMYTVLWPAVSRTIGVAFLRENFSLPFIFFFIYFYMKYLDTGKGLNILVAGGMLYIALASWHFTQFIYLMFIGYPASCVISDDGKKKVLQGFMILTCFAALAGLSVPFLRTNRFILSPAMLVSYSIVIVALLGRLVKMARVSRAVILLGVSGVLIFLVWPLSGDYDTYSHVYNLAVSKLRFLGLKPYEPGLVPLEARQLWSLPFSTPNIKHFLSNFFIITLISTPMVIKSIRDYLRSRKDKIGLCSYCLAASFILYWFSLRLRILLAFFVTLYAGGLMLLSKRKLTKCITASMLMLCFLSLSYQSLSVKIAPLSSIYEIDIFRWICLHTEGKSVILSTPFRSAQILAYTNRPIILHPKYETKTIRIKANEFNRALLEHGEEGLYRQCKKWNADYLVMPKGIYFREGGGSIRYVTNNLEAGEDVLAYRLEALPRQRKLFEGYGLVGLIKADYAKPKFEHFDLIYRNRQYLIYKIL